MKKTFNNFYDIIDEVRYNIQSYINADFGKNKKLDMVFMLYNFKDRNYVKTKTGNIDINFVAAHVEKELEMSVVPLYKEWLSEGTMLFAPIMTTINEKWDDNITIIDQHDPNIKFSFNDGVDHTVLELEGE